MSQNDTDIQTQPGNAEAAAGTKLVISRKSGCYALFPFYIMLDGKEISEIADGKQKEFAIAPGQHDLWIKYTLYVGSKRIQFNLNEGETKTFVCRPWLKWWQVFLFDQFVALVMPKKMIVLQEVKI